MGGHCNYTIYGPFDVLAAFAIDKLLELVEQLSKAHLHLNPLTYQPRYSLIAVISNCFGYFRIPNNRYGVAIRVIFMAVY